MPHKSERQLIDEFLDAMAAAGLRTSDKIIGDGELQRFHVEGDSPRTRNGWYVLHLDGIPAAEFGCWKRGVQATWCGGDREAEMRHRYERENQRLALRIAELEAAGSSGRDEWQPIETAPKDRLIDIWINEKGVGVRWCDCYYDTITDQWRTSRPSGHLLCIPARLVTHWMPLPAQPQSNKGGE